MIKVAIVDDHKMFRDGIAYILNATEGYHVLWTAEDKATTLSNLDEDFPDILLVDISLGNENGIDLTEEIINKYEDILILGLSMHHEEEYVIKMLEKGARGYLLKDSGIEELKKALNKLMEGEYYYNETVMRSLISRVQKSPDAKKSVKSVRDESRLTEREIEIIKLVAEELSNQEISEKLFISPRTVETHKRNMLSKLDVKNSIGLVRFAINHGLVDSKLQSS